MDESFIRMKKSCERIAAVLGIKDVNANIDEIRKSQTNLRRDPIETLNKSPQGSIRQLDYNH